MGPEPEQTNPQSIIVRSTSLNPAQGLQHRLMAPVDFVLSPPPANVIHFSFNNSPLSLLLLP